MSKAPRGVVGASALALVVAAFAFPAPEGQVQGKYSTCATCHQPNGQGLTGAFPPLAGSEIATGAPEIPIRIVILGVQGPLTVKGRHFNSTMPAWGTLTDAEIAATLTYVRSQWGNSASAVTAAQVAGVRGALAGRTRALTGAEVEAMRRGG